MFLLGHTNIFHCEQTEAITLFQAANDVIVTIRHNPLVQRALQHAFSIPLLMDSNGF